MEKQEYLIGDIAAITGLSRDTLRFYEKKGILTAKKKANGYRYFTEDDLYLLVRILFSRKLNLGLDDIESLMETAPLDFKHQNTLRRQIEKEKNAIRFHKQVLARLVSIKKIYESLEKCHNGFYMKPFPACRILHTLDSAADGLKQWFVLSQKYLGLDMVYMYDCYMYQSGFSLHASKETEGGCSHPPFYESELIYNCSRLLLYEEVIQCMEPEYDFSECQEFCEQAPCVYTVTETVSTKPLPDTIAAMRQWAADQGIIISPQVFVSSNFSRIRDKKCTYYQEIYIPAASP